jgi:hypothetical protein
MFGKRLLRSLAIGVGIVAVQLLTASSAFAYYVTVAATAVCDGDGAPAINYTVGSWATHLAATNTQVDVRFGSVTVDSQPFVLPDNTFSGSDPAPANATSVVVTAQAMGVWGDGYTGQPSASTTVSIPTNCQQISALGRFTGGPNSVEVGGASVTSGLTIHCDRLLSNNLEVNWGNGNRFHMLDHVETVACTDSPFITQKPPAAPLDTLIGVGLGRFNGADGYTIEFTLVDSGEPGKKNGDMVRLLIYRTADPTEVVLNVPMQKITGGNLQAHYDQPHK